MDDDTLRDELAIERTRLANERTLLAYVRTALALLAGGAALPQFFPASSLAIGSGAVLFSIGCFVLGLGTYRFVSARKKLNSALRSRFGDSRARA
jgi:putative membrane protein